MKVNIKRIHPDAILPEYQTEGAVGFDIYTIEDTVVPWLLHARLRTGLVVQVPEDHMLMLVPRSSTFTKHGLTFPHSAGIIDQDYCGEDDELLIQVWNPSGYLPQEIKKHTRIAQGVFVPVVRAEWNEVQEMKETSRGGFGSTNKSSQE